MNELNDLRYNCTRRHFLSNVSLGLGVAALSSLIGPRAFAGAGQKAPAPAPGGHVLDAPHLVPRAKRVIYLFQSGGPSQLDLFDYKPLLRTMNGEELPDSVRDGPAAHRHDRPTRQSFPLAGSQFEFAQHGKSGAWVSELLPHTAKIVDELCIVKSMHTEAINHDPAITFFQTGLAARRPARRWGRGCRYGLGTENENLPAFVVLISRARQRRPAALRAALGRAASCRRSTRACSSAAAATRCSTSPNPTGVDRDDRRRMLDAPARARTAAARAGAATRRSTRASRSTRWPSGCRRRCPDVTDLSDEPEHDLRAVRRRTRASRARSPPTACWRGGWPSAACASSSSITAAGTSTATCRPTSSAQCRGRPTRRRAALVTDLKQRGLLDDTLVVWGGEFGRTVYSPGQADGRRTTAATITRAASRIWMAGGGVKAGYVHGETDDFGYNVADDPVHVHDLHATILHLLGIDHETPDLQVPGPPLPPDRRPRQGRGAAAGLTSPTPTSNLQPPDSAPVLRRSRRLL